MRQINWKSRSRRGGLRAFAVCGIVLSIAVSLSGCREKKTETNLDSLAPDITGIAEQIKKNNLESGVRKTGEKWTKFVLIPGLTKFQLVRTIYENEPYQLKVYVMYTMKSLSKPVETEAQARAAKYDTESGFPVTFELIYQKDHWYLDKLSTEGMKAGPLAKGEIENLLMKSVRRML